MYYNPTVFRKTKQLPSYNHRALSLHNDNYILNIYYTILYYTYHKILKNNVCWRMMVPLVLVMVKLQTQKWLKV